MWLVVLAALTMCAQAKASTFEPRGRFFDLYGFGSVGSDMARMSNSAAGYGWMARGGIRLTQLGFFVEVQRDHWLATDKDIEMNPGVLNVGVGVEMLFFEQKLKMSLAAGTSTLLFDTIFDSAGTTGVYIDWHPATIRWPLSSVLAIEFSPLSAMLQVPVMNDPILKRLEYRTSLGLEMMF